MPTLILSPRYTPDSQILWQAALQQKWDVERLHSHTPPPHLRDGEPVLYGEGVFVRVVAEQLSLALIEPSLDWLRHLPFETVKRSVRFMQLSEAQKLTERAFIKPAGDKSFEAKVYKNGSELPEIDDLPVLVAEPVAWQREYRCFILNREIAAQSLYQLNGDIIYTDDNLTAFDEASTFAAAVVSNPNIAMPPAFVLDVGFIQDRGWAVVEGNPAWAAGIYGCDGANVLNMLRRTCVKYEDLSDSDKAWILSPFA